MKSYGQLHIPALTTDGVENTDIYKGFFYKGILHNYLVEIQEIV